MLVRVTLPLVVAPSLGWRRVNEVGHESAQASARGAAAGTSGKGAVLALDTPHRVVAGAALVSLAATALGWWCRPASTAAGGVLHVLAASLAYLGGPVVAVAAARRWLPRGVSRADGDAFAAGATVPIALAGALNIVPSVSFSFALAIAGAALSVRTAWYGAKAMLALEGQARIRAAAAPACLAVSVALLATSIRWSLPS